MSSVIWVAPTVLPSFNHKLALIHGGIVTLAGALGIVCNIIKYTTIYYLAEADRRVGSLLSPTSIGLATLPAVMSVMVTVTGAFGLASFKYKTSGAIITYLICSIISSVLCGVSLMIGIFTSVFSAKMKCKGQGCTSRNIYMSMESLFSVISLVVIIVSLWGCVNCCNAVCCGRLRAAKGTEDFPKARFGGQLFPIGFLGPGQFPEPDAENRAQ